MNLWEIGLIILCCLLLLVVVILTIGFIAFAASSTPPKTMTILLSLCVLVLAICVGFLLLDRTANKNRKFTARDLVIAQVEGEVKSLSVLNTSIERLLRTNQQSAVLHELYEGVSNSLSTNETLLRTLRNAGS